MFDIYEMNEICETFLKKKSKYSLYAWMGPVNKVA